MRIRSYWSPLSDGWAKIFRTRRNPCNLLSRIVARYRSLCVFSCDRLLKIRFRTQTNQSYIHYPNPGGRTAHSRFDISIDLSDTSTCGIRPKSQLAELLRQTSLIIWDEAPMDHKHAFEAVDKSLRDIMGTKDTDLRSKLFGGKTMLVGGDFRQVLPVVAKGKRQDVVQALQLKNICSIYCTTDWSSPIELLTGNLKLIY